MKHMHALVIHDDRKSLAKAERAGQRRLRETKCLVPKMAMKHLALRILTCKLHGLPLVYP